MSTHLFTPTNRQTEIDTYIHTATYRSISIYVERKYLRTLTKLNVRETSNERR